MALYFRSALSMEEGSSICFPTLMEPEAVRCRVDAFFLEEDLLREERDADRLPLLFLRLFLDAPPLSSKRRLFDGDDGGAVVAIEFRFVKASFREEKEPLALVEDEGDQVTTKAIAATRILILTIFLAFYTTS